MNAVAPSIAKRLYLLGFAGDVVGVAVLYLPARRGPLKIRIELDPIWRVEVNALYLTAQPFALRERSHDLQAVAEDHSVGPVGVVLIELGLCFDGREAIEVREEID